MLLDTLPYKENHCIVDEFRRCLVPFVIEILVPIVPLRQDFERHADQLQVLVNGLAGVPLEI